MVDKISKKTLMNVFFAVTLILLFAVFVFATTAFSASVVTRGNYSGSIFLNASTTLNTTLNDYNATYFYNASGGATGSSMTLGNNLTRTLGNESSTDNDFNVTIDITSLGLVDAIIYNISCYVDNGTNQEFTSVINVTFDQTPPSVNFTDTTSSVVNNGNYTSAELGTININISALDVIDRLKVINGSGSVYINVTYLNGTYAPIDNWTRALNLSTTNIFFNTSVNVTDYPDGKYNITVWANDTMSDTLLATQNVNSSEHIQITIDDTAPSSVTLTQLTSNTTTTQNGITITAVDVTSGINNCIIDGLAGDTITGTGSGAQTLIHAGLNCGTSYSYTVTCYDQAGNGLSSSSTSFSTTTCGSSSSGGSSTTTTTSTLEKVNVMSISSGKEATISNFAEEMGVKQIRIQVREESNNVRVTVRKFDSEPAEITTSKTGNVHRYFQVETENLGNKLERAVLTIRVQKNWLLDNTIDKANIALFRFDESAGTWNELSTVYTEEDEDYYYYDVELESFSYFAISEKALVGEEEEETSGGSFWDALPLWLWIVIGVVILGAVIGGGVATKKRR